MANTTSLTVALCVAPAFLIRSSGHCWAANRRLPVIDLFSTVRGARYGSPSASPRRPRAAILPTDGGHAGQLAGQSDRLPGGTGDSGCDAERSAAGRLRFRVAGTLVRSRPPGHRPAGIRVSRQPAGQQLSGCDAVVERVMHLGVGGEAAALEPLDQVELPQRVVPVEHLAVQPGHQLQ